MEGSVLSLLTGLLQVILLKVLPDIAPYQFTDTSLPQPAYDFIVVGAGAAGSVVAARLSEVEATVLLLEAGGSASPQSALPLLMTTLFESDLSLDIPTEPQTNSQQAYFNNSGFLTLGRAMGGTTTINGMLYVRGNPGDFRAWAREGNTGWDYNSVLRYYKKSEDFRGVLSADTEHFHGRGGPLSVEHPTFATPATTAFFRAGQELGYDIIDDSGPRHIGFAPTHMTVNNGVRASTSESFLRPNVGRANLHIRTSAPVTRIIFDSNKRAVGVRHKFKGKELEVRARKEVVLCAGAVFSPQLLMLSGVGPAAHLQEMGIPAVASVEGVGQNLQDHPVVLGLPMEVNKGTALNLKSIINSNAINEFKNNGTGLLAAQILLTGFGFVNLGGRDPAWPDLQVSVTPFSFSYDIGGTLMRRFFNIRPEYYKDILAPTFGKDTIALSTFLIKPKSRGWVKLRSAKAEDLPIVDQNYFSNSEDLEMLLKGVRFLFRLANTKAYKEGMGARYRSKPLRYCSHHPEDSDEYWRCFIRSVIGTSYHASGTCKMAPITDPMGVVSPRLRLRGVAGVRVVDASIMPEIVAANTMATAIMIGEKGADLIKEDWGYPVDPLS